MRASLLHGSVWYKSRECGMRICCTNNTHFSRHCLHALKEVPKLWKTILAKTSRDWCTVCESFHEKMLQFAERHQTSPAVPLTSPYGLWRGQGKEALASIHQRAFHPRERPVPDRPSDQCHRHKCPRAPMTLLSVSLGGVRFSGGNTLCLLSPHMTAVPRGWALQTSHFLWCGISFPLLWTTIVLRDLSNTSAPGTPG